MMMPRGCGCMRFGAINIDGTVKRVKRVAQAIGGRCTCAFNPVMNGLQMIGKVGRRLTAGIIKRCTHNTVIGIECPYMLLLMRGQYRGYKGLYPLLLTRRKARRYLWQRNRGTCVEHRYHSACCVHAGCGAAIAAAGAAGSAHIGG